MNCYENINKFPLPYNELLYKFMSTHNIKLIDNAEKVALQKLETIPSDRS